MSKKNFTSGLESLLGGEPKKKEIVLKEKEKSKPKDIRFTQIIEEEIIKNIKNIAYWERLKIKDVVRQAFIDRIEKYEKKNGKLKPMSK